MYDFKEDIYRIVSSSIQAVLPDQAVRKALENKSFNEGDLYLVAIGKAAYQMAKTAKEVLGEQIVDGIVITKYDHVLDSIDGITCYEAGHPVLDKNGIEASQQVLEMVSNLEPEDTVIFLVSGGGSALFEDPLVDLEDLQSINQQLLNSGASIQEINCIRKRLSGVKGGKFAKLCAPANIYTIVLSDILGDPLDMIASGPAYVDTSTSQEALDIVRKYHLDVSDDVLSLLKEEGIKALDNVETVVTGSVKEFVKAGQSICQELGYEVIYLSDQVDGQAKEIGYILGAIGKSHNDTTKSLAFILGGESVVKIQGSGKGGPNQELALAAAIKIDGLDDMAVLSISSDGSDGPTDATGGYVDTQSVTKLKALGMNVEAILEDNDSYHALQAIDTLIKTGPTGSNVNDMSILLIKR